MTMPVLLNPLARRLFLDRHALAEAPTGAATGAELAALIRRIGFVQIDSIATVDGTMRRGNRSAWRALTVLSTIRKKRALSIERKERALLIEAGGLLRVFLLTPPLKKGTNAIFMFLCIFCSLPKTDSPYKVRRTGSPAQVRHTRFSESEH